MRKVLLLRTSGQLLGAERVILEVAKYLPDLNYHPIIGVPYELNHPVPEFAETAQKQGYEVALFPVKSAFDMAALKTIKTFVQDNHVDIIHSHGYREDFYALFSKTQAKLVATNHLWKRTTLKLKLYAALDAHILKRFNAIVAVSEPVKQDMLEKGIDEQKITVIANGIDPANYQPVANANMLKEALNIPKDHIVIGTLSSLTVEKGIAHAIAAFAKSKKTLPNIHLLVVGAGEQLDNLIALTEQYQLTNAVTFAGRRSDINNVLNIMDIFALPSLSEGLPMAMLEAMAAQKAVIATTVGDVPKVINKDNGLLVAPGDEEALANAMVELASNKNTITSMGKAARQRVVDAFSSSAMASANVAIYNQLFNEQSR
ncbi:glycosyltransferase [Glaciecola sp. XM2]|uniref:glycosyltransferase n=1 Tax=Glaciecola sp. XM2 TaxID=1914931 RepID=UPI001BDEF441|nr:glycosyltransferase [Glaciecola sp. XM2]MBT1450658.1 glycosyltransferase [Glaciecola sp. XM2]